MKIKIILCWFFGTLTAIALIAGLITHFTPVHGSKDMSRFQMEWYQFTHYWYIWLSLMVGFIGFHFSTKD